MLDTLKRWVPITYDAFIYYRVGGTELSAKGKLVIQKFIKGENVDFESSGLSKREWNELMEAFNLKNKLIWNITKTFLIEKKLNRKYFEKKII